MMYRRLVATLTIALVKYPFCLDAKTRAPRWRDMNVGLRAFAHACCFSQMLHIWCYKRLCPTT